MDIVIYLIVLIVCGMVFTGCYGCYKFGVCDCCCKRSYASSSSSDCAVQRTNYPAAQYSSNAVQNRNIYSQRSDLSDDILLGIALNQFQKEQARDIALLTKELIEIQQIINNGTLQDVINLSIVFLHHLDYLQNSLEGLKMLEDFRELLRAIRDEIVSALQTRRTIRIAIIERNGNQIRGIVAQFQA
ncbi:hypothetical protein TVAG_273400 [Trichomonas vaginalis G3]|uniref:Uncharacterized protein n=1 Tax=Trichomonas vaginalis (strain ATCC PRA-98 / G3) TaxID=412133 RepID=A2GIV3_TRIV3|nr:hypothetical protein TVAGG3_0704720 [Trichomonas vaginalis G3]EAX82914.1 hypothetical protein TVAG_273400 [Trichomonas vaginalis G3]KAI5509490.1 hypothetical protein TVAGG3_0704720 [Trichomonas vaginalis G3]|eukprot:XP_001295844.1 hypothetical protein [Trichomonas vaginalis G3]